MADYYAVLGLQRTASKSDIISAFREFVYAYDPNLHPRRFSEVTDENFQKIYRAYRVLSVDSQRRQYDATLNANAPQARADNANEAPQPLRRRRGNFLDVIYEIFSGAYEARLREAWRLVKEKQAQLAQLAEDQRREVALAYVNERKAKEKEEEERRKLEIERREQVKLAAEQAKLNEAKAKEAARELEIREQHARWEKMGANTDQEKFSACLHSSFCTKTRKGKKFKCEACGARRGIIAFLCPHCGRDLCQLCVTTFAQQRARDRGGK
ncbi:hypothetical protein NUW58_g7700 [Xylaria curta]|uniref:Uncharacterized protein n=1 Tax=Xylaria curta TaxID=42375 RepID=A0ACC1NG18_9PEZI|nr:hypothetical protein NUW58_g7700 [Xylaria curta]